MRRLPSAVALLVVHALLVLPSCAVVETIPYEPVAYPSKPKIEHKVLVRLPESFSESGWKQERLGRELEMKLGGALTQHIAALAKHVFVDAVIEDPANPVKTGVDAILSATLVDVLRTHGSDERTTVLLEWSLTDPADRQLWVQTVAGTGAGGRTDLQTQGRAALEELFKKSFEEMSAAVEIQRRSSR